MPHLLQICLRPLMFTKHGGSWDRGLITHWAGVIKCVRYTEMVLTWVAKSLRGYSKQKQAWARGRGKSWFHVVEDRLSSIPRHPCIVSAGRRVVTFLEKVIVLNKMLSHKTLTSLLGTLPWNKSLNSKLPVPRHSPVSRHSTAPVASGWSWEAQICNLRGLLSIKIQF